MMKSLGRFAFSVTALAGVGWVVGIAQTSAADKATARAKITDGYERWNSARSIHDKAAFEKLFAPDFYMQLKGPKLTRQQLIDQLTTENPNVKLVKVETEVLTVIPRDKDWEAIISERQAYDGKGPDGATHHVVFQWVTRDGWHQDGDNWQALYSEEVSSEMWRDTKSPFAGW